MVQISAKKLSMPSTVVKLTVNVPLNLKVREVFEVFTRGQKGTLKKPQEIGFASIHKNNITDL